MSAKRETIGSSFGRLEDERLLAVTRSLAIVLGMS
jgi:hypothetical protein